MLIQHFLDFLVLKDIAVVIDLFQHKNVHLGDVYHCYSDFEALQMQKLFILNNIRVSSKIMNQSTILQWNKPDKFGIFVNASCDGWINLFETFNENSLKTSLVWFVMSGNFTDTIGILSRYKLDLNSHVTVVSKVENWYVLHEVYNTGYNKNGRYVVKEMGVWNGSLYVEHNDRKNLLGTVLRATVVIPQTQRVANRTFLKYLEEETPDLVKADPMHKFKGFTALKYIRDMFNITYEFQRTNSWGYPTNGTFDGLVGALQRRETDIGGSPLFIRTDRMAALDYAAETWLTRPTFIFRHPKHPGGYFSIYTRPLTTEVWYCVVLIMTLSAAILAMLLNLKIIKTAGDDEDMSPSLAMLVIWSAICQQGMSITRSSNSVKLVMFSTFLCALTVFQYYNATVVSTLLHEQPKNIRTLKDLTRSSLAAGIEDILYNKDYFRRTTDTVAREIYLKKVVHSTPHRFYSPEQGMAMVKKGGFAFHVDSAVAYRIMRHTFSEKELCELQEVPVFGSYLGLAVVKQSPYREILAYGIRRLKEHGIISRLFREWDERRPPCVRTPDASLISVSILEFSTALVALTLGYCAALLVFAAEVIASRMGKNRVISFRH